MPIIATILGIASAVAGTVSQFKQQGIEQNALNEQNTIAKQELADKQQVFNQDEAFYTPYTKSGSPFLQNIQSAAAGQAAQQGNNAAGTFRQQADQSGLGYGPSGARAAGLAGIGASQAASGASNYLQNLLANEQIKFQAQQGLNAAGTLAGSPQNQPNVGTTLPPANGFSSLGALGQTINSATSGSGGPTGGIPQAVPGDTSGINIINGAIMGGTPTVQGWGFPT